MKFASLNTPDSRNGNPNKLIKKNSNLKSKNGKSLIRAALLLGSLGLTTALTAQAQAATIDYNGVNYNLSWQNMTYTGSTALLTSQPWWGNSTLAHALASYNVNPNSNFGNQSSYFVYSIAGNTISSAYYSAGNTATITYPSNQTYWSLYVLSATADQSLLNSLQSTSAAANGMLNQTGLLVNGAHSHPLDHLVATGEKTLWVTGDFGTNDHGGSSGNIGIAEVSGGYNFGRYQLNLSLGQTSNRNDLIYGGSAKENAQFVTAEAIVPISKVTGLYGTFGVYDLWGTTNINRGFLNTNGTVNSSYGSPNLSGWGAWLAWIGTKQLVSKILRLVHTLT